MTGSFPNRSTGVHVVGSEIQSFRGRHTITTGGEYPPHRQRCLRSAESTRQVRRSRARAPAPTSRTFSSGCRRRRDLAFGNPDKFYSSNTYAAYVTDDWRMSPSFTMTLGVRWEYESPISERHGRLVNLDVAEDFSAIAPVSGRRRERLRSPATSIRTSLVRPDKGGFQPRLGIAWRPVPGSSLVVRAGYGVYRNTNVYQSIATQLAQQPPLSTSFSIGHTLEHPLTLADGFVVGRALGVATTLNTFAVDPDLRVGYAQNWQASVQRDLPMSLTVNATYLGSKGSNLMQAFVPNTYPVGAVNPCPTCPTGFRYVVSDGRSLRHAGQVQLRRRLRNGFTSSVQYTLAKAMDNAGSFSGATIDGQALAQNWLDLEAEYARSNFDQRHQVVATFEYTTGAGILGGTLLDGWRGRLFKDWTLTSQITTGSGNAAHADLLLAVCRNRASPAARARASLASRSSPLMRRLVCQCCGFCRSSVRRMGHGAAQRVHRPGAVLDECVGGADVPRRRADQSRLAGRRDQRAESGHLQRGQQPDQQPAVRVANRANRHAPQAANQLPSCQVLIPGAMTAKHESARTDHTCRRRQPRDRRERAGPAAAAAAAGLPQQHTPGRQHRRRPGQGRQGHRRAHRQGLRRHRGRAAAGDRVCRVPAARRGAGQRYRDYAGRRDAPAAAAAAAAAAPRSAQAPEVASAFRERHRAAAVRRHQIPEPPAAHPLFRSECHVPARSDARLRRRDQVHLARRCSPPIWWR